jgi:hypothetical protein
VPEDGVERVAEEVSGMKLRTLFDRWLRATAELPLENARNGVAMKCGPRGASDRDGRPRARRCGSGLRSARTTGDGTTSGYPRFDGGAALTARTRGWRRDRRDGQDR